MICGQYLWINLVGLLLGTAIWRPCIGKPGQAEPYNGVNITIPIDARIVDLSNNNRTTIDRTFFRYHYQLILLIMSNNEAFDMPKDNQFIENNGLKSFYCNNCGITKIFRLTLHGIPDLRNLELKHNHLQYIHKDAFEQTTKMGYINLEHNKLARFNEAGVLNHLTHMRTLLMSHNANFTFADDVPLLESPHLIIYECRNCGNHLLLANVFKRVPNLGYIDLSGQNISHIDDDAFAKIGTLRELDISNNRQLSHWRLINTNLRRLACNNCSLETITKDMFKNLPQLETLELRGNRIRSIGMHTFDGNHYLSTLLLDYNEMRTFPYHVIDRKRRLTALCLDNNPLVPSYNNTVLAERYVTKGLRQGKCSGTKYDYFETNLKEIVDQDVMVLVNETEAMAFADGQANTVNLTQANLFYIAPGIYERINNVTTAIVEFNPKFNLQQHDPFLIHDTIEYVHLRNNNISAITSTAFGRLPNLLSLDMSWNRIQSIANDAFLNNTQLQHLRLANNKITRLVYVVLDHLVGLSTLSLSENHLFDIDEHRIFLYQPHLVSFECENCMIRNIGEDTFARMPSLQRIWLSGNRIKVIADQAFRHNKRLQELKLQGNPIDRINSTLWRPLTNLTQLCLNFNSIQLVSDCKDAHDRLETLARECDCAGSVSKMWKSRQNVCVETTTVSTSTTIPTTESSKKISTIAIEEVEIFAQPRIASMNYSNAEVANRIVSEKRSAPVPIQPNSVITLQATRFSVFFVMVHFLMLS